MAAYSNDRRVPDARVEDWMEVVQSQDPASMAVEASVDSPLAMKSPVSPGSQSVCSTKSDTSGHVSRKRHKPQNFNRSNVHIEDYILRQPEDINAKEMRVLIPAMFQKQLHPDKETTKTKVKGLWEPGNKPLDFPRDVDFKDPNNSSKMVNEMMKKFFMYLKTNLLQNHPEYRYGSRGYSERIKPAAPVVEITPVRQPLKVPHTPLPNLEAFHVINDGHDAKSTFIPQDQPAEFKYDQRVMKQELMSPLGPIIPETVELLGRIKDEDLDPLPNYRNFGVQGINSKDAQHVDQLPDSTHDMQKQQIMMMTQPPAAEAVPYHSYTTRDSAGNMVTELTILHNMSLSETPPQHTIVLQGDVLRNPAGDGLRHPVNPQEVTTETEVVPMPPQEYPDSTQNSECAAFVEATRNALTPILAKFETIFTGNPEVIQFTVCLLGELLEPMLQVASQGNKEMALQVSRFCSSLQGILQRANFLGAETNPLEELMQLKYEYMYGERVNQDVPLCGESIPDSEVPEFNNEVQVCNAATTVRPNLQLLGPYIPTIAGIEARAQQKEQKLDGINNTGNTLLETPWLNQKTGNPCEMETLTDGYQGNNGKPTEKVIVEVDPYPESLSPITKDLSNVHIESELGILLNRNISCDEDTADPKAELDRLIKKEKIKRAQKAASQGQPQSMDTTDDHQALGIQQGPTVLPFQHSQLMAPSGGSQHSQLMAPSGGSQLNLLMAPSGGSQHNQLMAPSGGSQHNQLMAPSGGSQLNLLMAPSGGSQHNLLMAPSGGSQHNLLMAPSGGSHQLTPSGSSIVGSDHFLSHHSGSYQPEADNEDEAISATLQQAERRFGCENTVSADNTMATNVTMATGQPNYQEMVDGDISEFITTYIGDENNVAVSDQFLNFLPITNPVVVQRPVSAPPQVLDPYNTVRRTAPNIPTTVYDKAASTDDDDMSKAKRPRTAKGKGKVVNTSRGKGYKKQHPHGKGKGMF